MGFGLFGKLPQKRDFISFGIPGDILQPLETWLQSAVAASRSELGRGWEELYLVAPIWRFWIGADVFGRQLRRRADAVGRRRRALLSADGPLCLRGRRDHAAAVLCAAGQMVRSASRQRLLGVLDEDATRRRRTSFWPDLPTPALDGGTGRPGAVELQGRTRVARRVGRPTRRASWRRSSRTTIAQCRARPQLLVGAGQWIARTGPACPQRPAGPVFPYADAAGCGRLSFARRSGGGRRPRRG